VLCKPVHKLPPLMRHGYERYCAISLPEWHIYLVGCRFTNLLYHIKNKQFARVLTRSMSAAQRLALPGRKTFPGYAKMFPNDPSAYTVLLIVTRKDILASKCLIHRYLRRIPISWDRRLGRRSHRCRAYNTRRIRWSLQPYSVQHR
jgi:hypothetical protein